MSNGLMIAMPDLPKEYLQEIGFLAVETAWIDRSLLNFIARLAFDEPMIKDRVKKAECLVGGEGFETLLKKLTKLFTVKITDSSISSEFEEICKLLTKVNKKRSEYVHSCLTYNEGWRNVPPEVRTEKVARDMNAHGEMRRFGKTTLDDIMKACDDARAAHNKLTQFMAKVDSFRAKAETPKHLDA